MGTKNRTKMAPWLLSSFDMEGIAGGALALLAAFLLGAIWAPLFWLGFLAAIVILLATRDAERVPPDSVNAVLAPCDGIVTGIDDVEPPRELRFEGNEVRRIRISSSPFSVNGLRAPATGTVESFLVEPGSPTAIATDPDNPDLDEAYATFSTDQGLIGIRVASGGLGPRIDLDLEPQDGVRAGRKIGVRRLGGWCDIFLPLGSEPKCYLGMTVVGGETQLSELNVSDNREDKLDTVEASETVSAPSPTTETVAESPDEPVERKVPTPDDFEGSNDLAASVPAPKAVKDAPTAATPKAEPKTETVKTATKAKAVKPARPKAAPPKGQSSGDDSSS